MCRCSLVDEDRGKSVVFKTVDLPNVWAIGLSDIHFKTFISTQGNPNPNPNPRPNPNPNSQHFFAFKGLLLLVNPPIKKDMGYIDRHNRLRQNILGFAKVWRTKKWQVRVILEIFGMAVVDSSLLARKFIPRWQNADTDDGLLLALCNYPFAASGYRVRWK
jgi:hypothetical protein